MKPSITVIATSLALVGRATAGPWFKLQDADPNPPFKIGECQTYFNLCNIGSYWIHVGYHREGNGQVKKWEASNAGQRCGAKDPCKNAGDKCSYSFTAKTAACSIDSKKLSVVEPPVNVGPKKPATGASKKARRDLRTEGRARRY
ncbi:hypothetical protein V2G26_013508 [Clonostachys chloroleuca]